MANLVKNVLCILSSKNVKIDVSLGILINWHSRPGNNFESVTVRGKYFDEEDQFWRLTLDYGRIDLYIQTLTDSQGSMDRFLRFNLPIFDAFVYLTPDYSHTHIPQIADLYREHRRAEIETNMRFFDHYFRGLEETKDLLLIQLYDHEQPPVLLPEILGDDFRGLIGQKTIYEACSTEDPYQIIEIIERYF
jgi:hypothetical protein